MYAVVRQVDAGIDMTLPDEDECTLLHYAALGGNVDLIEYVLKKNKNRDIDERNNAGETALLRCAIQGNVGVGWLLLQKGAKLLAVDKNKVGNSNNISHPLRCGGLRRRQSCAFIFNFFL